MTHARWCVRQKRPVQEEIASLKSGLSGQASVGAVTPPGTNLVPLAVGLLEQKHPGLITRRKHRLSPGAQALLDAIRTTARTLYLPTGPTAFDSGESIPLEAPEVA